MTEAFAAKLRAVEDDLARLKGARERMNAAADRLRATERAAPTDLTTRSSPDGLATVSCRENGRVHLVEVDSDRYNKVSEKRLCQAVADARSYAREAALARSDVRRAALDKKGEGHGSGR
ncbi:MAG TPA: hypothetical protein H9881_12455 [Candidatus Stackebrandtia excrementipullorum]|nr:hypothetical protein [Candidatus Stackebrandtia excrementipullorum]